MSAIPLQTWLVDTLLWTGALMALVMAVRQPVARLFGPGLAYALWLLPLLRLIVPPLTLPESAQHATAGAPLVVPVLAASPAAQGAILTPAASAGPGFDYLAALLVLWAIGAIGFAGWRFAAYHTMRRRVLGNAVELGRIGRVRVVESVEVGSPVAFGVIDKIVALPPGFAAMPDRAARNLAMRHELQHHDGGDILLNMAMQPLFAMHWFNPLAWLAWRALRRDQEAACDARVLAGEPACERESYARLIAGIAAGAPHHRPLPLACPVAGEKSIVHRLRSLTMTEPSRRRRRAGRTLVALGALALPLTATVTYAQMNAPAPPAPPPAPQAPAAPQAPSAPDAPMPPAPLMPPAPPAPPAPPSAPSGATGVNHIVMLDGGNGGQRYTRHFQRDGQSYTVETDRPMSDEELNRQIEQAQEQARQAGEQAREAGRQAREAGLQAAAEARRAALAQVDARRIDADAQRTAARAMASAEASVCRGHTAAVVTTGTGEEQQAARIRDCALSSARAGIMAARASIAANRNMGAEIRADVLRSLDNELAHLGDDS